MKETLKPGIEFEFTFKIPESKIVSGLYPEASEFQVMPRVFATGFMVGLMEWTCIQAVNPHIDWPDEQTVGTRINVNHIAATPPGFDVTVAVKLVKVDVRRLEFEVAARDEVDMISQGTHERFVIKADSFNRKVDEKAKMVSA
jgi:fluoroacetyl-CoA thioesterase